MESSFVSVADSIRGYSGESFEQVASVALGFSQYFQNVGVAVNRNTNRVYVAWSGNNSLFMIDGNTHLITKNVVPSYFNETVMVNPNTDKVYVGTTILDGETLEQVSTSLDESIEAIDPINNLLYTVGTLNYLFRLNGSSHVLIDSVQLPWTYFSYYDRVPVNPASSKIYITNYYDNKTCVVSAGSPPEPTPSPTPSPTPTATPSPTPTATPTPTPTPTAPPTPKPTQSPSPSPPPTPSPSPTATPTPTPSPSPEPKGFSLPMEGIYVGIGVIAIAAIAGTAILVKKPQKRTNKGYPPPLPPPPIFQT